MYPMGALQPGIPPPVMLPKDWPVTVIDLQDFFFTIPVHKLDRPSFAFSSPQLNHKGPHQ